MKQFYSIPNLQVLETQSCDMICQSSNYESSVESYSSQTVFGGDWEE